jgi:hypothetical protein
MASIYEPRTDAEAKATIQAELDKIMERFSNSLSRCHEAAEFLMSGSGWHRDGITKLKPRRGCRDLRECSTADNRPIRARAV